MKRIILILTLLISARTISYSQLPGPVLKDVEGNRYQTVKLGTQTWMAENLNVRTFKNGDIILEAKTPEEWKQADLMNIPAWCYYNNDPANGPKYGKLYNYWAIIDPRGLAPAKWHIPNDEEWQRVTLFLGGAKVAGGKMKSTTGWNNKNGTNKSNFSAIPGGSRDAEGLFRSIGNFSIWWSMQEYGAETAWGREIGPGNKISRFSYQKGNGFSIRCVRD